MDDHAEDTNEQDGPPASAPGMGAGEVLHGGTSGNAESEVEVTSSTASGELRLGADSPTVSTGDGTDTETPLELIHDHVEAALFAAENLDGSDAAHASIREGLETAFLWTKRSLDREE